MSRLNEKIHEKNEGEGDDQIETGVSAPYISATYTPLIKTKKSL